MITEKEKEFRALFAANLKDLRMQRGLTQKQLGLLCGMTETSAERSIQKWEYKAFTPSAYNIRLLADALKCKPDDLIPKMPK